LLFFVVFVYCVRALSLREAVACLFVGDYLVIYKFNKFVKCRKHTYELGSFSVLRKRNAKAFVGKLNFSLVSFLGSCRIYSVRVGLVSRLIKFYEGLGLW